MVIVGLNAVLNFSQLYRSQQALDALRRRVATSATCLRDGAATEIPRSEVVPGDVALLRAGDVVPADGRLLEAKDLFVSEAALTGESMPVEKAIGSAADALLAGSSVMSGSGRMLGQVTGAETEFGQIAAALADKPVETEFDRGIRSFAVLITRLVVVLVAFVLIVNVVLGRGLLESLLFAIALAIGLTPELLPMITSVTLAHGAVRMARKQVLIKRLPAMHNLGSMDVLCSDKTGTLTAGAIVLNQWLDAQGQTDPDVLRLGAINSRFESGLASPLDAAITAAAAPTAGIVKIDEIPFDFDRGRVSVVVDGAGPARLLITKGAPESILPVCASYRVSGELPPLDDEARSVINLVFHRLSEQGYRVLAVASRAMTNSPPTTRAPSRRLFLTDFSLR